MSSSFPPPNEPTAPTLALEPLSPSGSVYEAKYDGSWMLAFKAGRIETAVGELEGESLANWGGFDCGMAPTGS